MKALIRRSAVFGLAAMAVVVSGCGSNSDGGSSTAGAGPSSAVQAQVDDALGPKGSFKEPAGGAPKPKAGATIALISCGQQIQGCAEAMAAAEEAAGLVGWKTTLFDTKGDPTTAGTGIRQAVASEVDGMFLYAIDCPYVKAPLQEAQKAGIPVYQSQGLDCDGADSGSEPLFTGSNVYSEGEGFFDFWASGVETETNYAITKNAEAANILYVGDDTLHLSKVTQETVKETTAKCSGCTYSEVVVPITDIGTKLQGAVEQKLLQNPKTNAIIVPYQDITLGGVTAAVRGANKQKQILVSTGEGSAASMDLVRSGQGKYFGFGFSNAWEGWAAVDGLTRLMASQEPANSGIGVQLYDADHNTPSSGAFQPPVDFKAAYKASWGVGS